MSSVGAALVAASTGATGGVIVIFYIAVIALMIASMWKVFAKAGRPGWACLIPIYNIVVMLQIVDRPVWWVLLYFIPIVNWIVALVVALELAKYFGKGSGFGIGLWLVGIVFYPILAFGDAAYLGSRPAAAPASASGQWNQPVAATVPAWAAPATRPPWATPSTPAPAPQYSTPDVAPPTPPTPPGF
jgi:hypothetical protein